MSGLIQHHIIKPAETFVPPALFRGDGIRTHGGIAPTQPFQDCTLNLSDTPLLIYQGFRFSCSICAHILIHQVYLLLLILMMALHVRMYLTLLWN